MDQRNNKQEGMHLGELLHVLKLRKKLVLALTFATVLGTIVREIVYVPTFPAVTTLNVQKSENSPLASALSNMGGGYYADNAERLQKYLNYLGSNEFFLAVAENLKFQEGYSRLNLTHPAEMSVVRKKFWEQFLNRTFNTKIGSLEAAPIEPVLVPVEKLAGLIQSMTSASLAGTDTIQLSISTLDPFTSMVLANTASDVFAKKTVERDYAEVAEVKRFIKEQLDSTTERLKRSELALVEFKKRHNIISIAAEHTNYSTRISGVESDLERTKLKYDENQKLIHYYENLLGRTEKKILAHGAASVKTSPGSVANRLRQQLDSLRYKKVLMQAQGYSDDSWQTAEINREIDRIAVQLKGQLATVPSDAEEDDSLISPEAARAKLQLLKQENQQTEAKLASLERSRTELLKTGGDMPKDEQVLLTLTRDVDLQFELYSSLKKKLQEVEIQQVALQSHVSVSQRAGMPGPAARTSLILKILFAVLVGLFIGSSLAFMLEALDPTIKHRSDLEAMELGMLGTLPRIQGSLIRSSLGVQSYRPDLLICKEKPESPESMAFKHIRSQITLMPGANGRPAQVITITSPERGDGKSFVAGNLAVCVSQLGRRTLLIDADFRNPSQPWLFGYKSGEGISGLLSFKAPLDEVIIKDRVESLDILPTGWMPNNPSELIANEKFRILIQHLRTVYDYIIIDAPPVIAVVDASTLASISDASILVANFRKTRKETMVLALRRLLQVTHKNVFSVLNNVWELEEHQYYVYQTQPLTPSNANETVDMKDELARFEETLTKRKAG